MDVVYKVMQPDEWAAAVRAGAYAGSALDRRDGFIHLSTVNQVEETVERHFADSGRLTLVAVDVAQWGDALRFEPSRGGALFPHLYTEIKVADILWAKDFDSARPGDLKSLIAE